MEAPVKVAQLFFDRLDGHDLDGALGLLAHEANLEVLPLRLRGPAGGAGRTFLGAVLESFPDLRVVVRNAIAGGDGTVVAEVNMEGTQSADFYGIVNQAKHVDIDQAWVVRVADGEITSLRAYWCQNQVYRRLAVKRLDRVTITAQEF